MLVLRGVLAQADAQALPFRDNYFHSVVTSPPYFGLRAYTGGDIQRRIWGGRRDCKHDWQEDEQRMQTGVFPKSNCPTAA